MPYRRYLNDNQSIQRKFGRDCKPQRALDWKNPMRNYMRLLCRNCYSNEHLLLNSDELSGAQLIRYISRYCLQTLFFSDSGECGHALDIAQNYDEESCRELEDLNGDNEAETANTLYFNWLSADEESVKEHCYAILADSSFSHLIIHSFDYSIENIPEITLGQAPSTFDGICIDNGAQKSTACLPSFHQYCSFIRSYTYLILSQELFLLGGIVYRILGTSTIRFPIDSKWNFLEYVTDIIDLDIPFLFGLEKMRKMKWYVKEVTDEFCSYPLPYQKIKLHFLKGHLYLRWPKNVVLYSRRDLWKIHRRFCSSIKYETNWTAQTRGR